ncbi:MAG: hypothetical protein HY698_16635 [Deltaproteobacteria bacterium]|nr:hypothetical protein [Deltaproteobacteria bacterium]
MRTASLCFFLLAPVLGCSFLQSDPSSRACRNDDGCFKAQGEYCNKSVGKCERIPDAGPDARPKPDAKVVPDADLPDGSTDEVPDGSLDAPAEAVDGDVVDAQDEGTDATAE